MIEVITEEEGILDICNMTETEESILHLEVDPEVTMVQQGHTEDKTTIHLEVTTDRKDLEVNPDLEFHQGFQDIKIDVSLAANLIILAKNVLRRTHLQARCSIKMK